MAGVGSPAVPNLSGARPCWYPSFRRVAGAMVWHGTMILACAFVLVPIVMVVLGSFKTVNEFFASPYGLPQSFGLHN
jgi:ABC-type glycerol-3-phosphate transport system permease component